MSRIITSLLIFTISTFSWSQNNFDEKQLDSIINKVVDFKYNNGKRDSDFNSLFALLSEYDNIKNPELKAKADFNLGFYYYQILKFETSIFYYQKALKEYRNQEKWKSYVNVSKNLATVYSLLNKHEESEKVLLNTMQLVQNEDVGFYILKPLQELAVFYSYYGKNPSKAIYYGNKFYTELEYFSKNHIEDPEFKYSKTIDAAIVDLEMGNSYLALNEYEKAKKYLLRSQAFFSPTNDQEKLSRINKHLFHLAVKTNQPADSIEKQLNKYDNSISEYIRIYKTSVYKVIEDATEIYEYQIDLKKQKEENKKLKHHRNIITVLFIALFIISLISLQILIKLYKVQKDYNQKLLQEKEVLESIAKEKTMYFSIISHELRTPVYSITGILEILKQEKNPTKQDELINSLQLSNYYLTHLINNILVVNNDEEKKQINSFETQIDVFQFLENIVKKYKPLAIQKGININVKTTSKSLIWVKTDWVKLEQIIVNLLLNAIKFSPENEVIYINLSCEKQNLNQMKATFSISDNGPGINSELKESVLRGEKKLDVQEEINTNRMQGIGVGLFASQKLLHLFNSELKIDTEKERGSTFSFDVLAEIVTNNSENETSKKTINFPITVLSVDDNRMNLLVSKKMLENIGIKCFICTDQDDYLSIIEQENIELALIDINMPTINGYEMSKKIKSKFKIPIIAHTAGGEITKNDFQIVDAKIDDVLIKPYAIDDLKNKIIKLLPTIIKRRKK
ncbi:response regulator [Flavobacterium azooxidireducens]|uniref:histidine kinase n=1 Tax=Flavobacterium azooxidireducens TaxID=1871076 RepID=A0ABY4KJS3_9FLAO|nr:response regulator [Flavobacterium azooxidireducens]UPQ80625.1 response regulator [Flavobacterium azooxidireducens]